jgi:hypothetical protein
MDELTDYVGRKFVWCRQVEEEQKTPDIQQIYGMSTVQLSVEKELTLMSFIFSIIFINIFHT